MSKHILLAIDGTDSLLWRDDAGHNSHVRRFYLDFTGEKDVTKKFMDGPGLSGRDMPSIIDQGVTWILEAVQRLDKQGVSANTIKIDLVGHSRGGFGVMAIANNLNGLGKYEALNGYVNTRKGLLNGLPPSLQLRVNFIGLYDAVKMAPFVVDPDSSLSNVDYLAHARRLNPPIFRVSRPTFLMGGMDTRNSLYFDTSHGGIGGDPGFFNDLAGISFFKPTAQGVSKVEAWSDLYCNALQLVLSNEEWQKIKPSKSNPFSWIWLGNEDNTSRSNKIRQYLTASRMADKFIRNEAQTAGVPFKGITPHIPWNTHDRKQAKLGRELFKILGMT